MVHGIQHMAAVQRITGIVNRGLNNIKDCGNNITGSVLCWPWQNWYRRRSVDYGPWTGRTLARPQNNLAHIGFYFKFTE